MRNKLVIVLSLAFLLLCGIGFLFGGRAVLGFLTETGILTAPEVQSNIELDVVMPNEVEPTATAESRPEVVATNEGNPMITLVNTPTPEDVPFTGLTINSCPTASLGYHPDSGEPLIFKMHPYPGDTNVLCEYEILDLTQEVKVLLPGDISGIVADWSHGTYNFDGTLKDACPKGWECEGVWVAREDFIVPVGTLVHVSVYIREQPASVRFTQTITWTEPAPGFMAPFACEYVATQGHSMWNIRVPAWAQDQGNVGTIYGFGRPVNHPERLTCAGYPIDWEPHPGQLTTK